MAKTMKLSLAAPVALLLFSSAASAAMACGSAEEGLVFGEVVSVNGSEDTFRLSCRQGRLIAIPVGADGTTGDERIDEGGPPVSIEGTAPAKADGSGGTGTADARDTGVNAAGVAGQAPAASVTRSAAEAPTSPSTLPPLDQRGDTGADKPGVSAEAAAAGKEGKSKSEERIAPEAPAAEAAQPASAASPEMVRVPAAIAGAARGVLPGITFKNVVLSREGASTVYGLAGENQAGRGVAVDVDQAGKVLRVDRQVGMGELPPEILKLAQAVLPEATIDKAMMSLRPNFQSFFVLSGRTAKAEDFTLDIRTDGRSLAFIDPR